MRNPRLGGRRTASPRCWRRSSGVANSEVQVSATSRVHAGTTLLRRRGSDCSSTSMESRVPPCCRWTSSAARHTSHPDNRTWNYGRDKTPYDLLLGRRPDVSHLRVIGSKAYTHRYRQLAKCVICHLAARLFSEPPGSAQHPSEALSMAPRRMSLLPLDFFATTLEAMASLKKISALVAIGEDRTFLPGIVMFSGKWTGSD